MGTRRRCEDDTIVYLEITEYENVGWVYLVRDDILRISGSSEHSNEPPGSLKCSNCCTIERLSVPERKLFQGTLVNDQLDTQLFYFIVRLLHTSTCFEQRRAYHQEVELY